MKKTVCLILLPAIIALAVCPILSAGEPTYMEKIQSGNKVIAEATERIKKNNEDVEAYYTRGSAHFMLGQIYIIMYNPAYSKDQNTVIKSEFEAAAADFSAVVDLKADFVQAYIMRGMAYGQMGLSAAAVSDFTHAIAIDEHNGYAYYARGREYWETGDYLKAKEDYDKAVDLDPQWKDNFYK
jgi:tetratricopeptide (TPR) repeat protein